MIDLYDLTEKNCEAHFGYVYLLLNLHIKLMIKNDRFKIYVEAPTQFTRWTL